MIGREERDDGLRVARGDAKLAIKKPG